MLPLARIAKHLAPDGALRDIYVFDVSASHWAAAWEHIVRAYPDLTFYLGSRDHHLPATVGEAFAFRPADSPRINFSVGSVNVACHFFSWSELEFDFRPEEVNTEAAWVAVQGFMASLGRFTSRPVHLTIENMRTEVIATFDPASEQWCAPRQEPGPA